MAFRTTIRHQRIALSVAASAASLADDTRSVMAEKLAPFLREGESMPDAGLMQELLGRFLLAQGEELIAVDHSYNVEVREHRLLRLRYFEAMAEVRQLLRQFRFVVDSVFDSERCTVALGTRNFTTRNAGLLAGLARQAAYALREPKYYFEKGASPALGASSAELADSLEAAATSLYEVAERQLTEQRKRRQIELGNKEETVATAREAISEASSLLKGLFVFTGNAPHARRLRPSHRKKGGGGKPESALPPSYPPASRD